MISGHDQVLSHSMESVMWLQWTGKNRSPVPIMDRIERSGQIDAALTGSVHDDLAARVLHAPKAAS